MKSRIVFSLVLLLASSFVAASAADVTGHWNLVATSAYGEEYNLELILEEAEGVLKGTLESPDGSVALEKVTLTDTILTFEVWVSGSSYNVKLELADNQLTGTYEGGGETGKVIAKRP